ncbi:MAG: serine/threonine protein phosphatase [Magnetococcales bacterium]|nr:serine/threonine protein phosphatase [Magnetococcales bacterium]
MSEEEGLAASSFLDTRAVSQTREVRGVILPAGVVVSRLVVTGPPGCGKTSLIDRLRGWPGEVCLDLTSNLWWRSPALNHCPREVHFAVPFVGEGQSCPVYDQKWDTGHEWPDIDFTRLQIPSGTKGVLSPNWLTRLIFEFMLPSPDWIYDQRLKRAESGTHHVDQVLSMERIQWQVFVHWRLAEFFHRCGLLVYVREGVEETPRLFDHVVYPEEPLEQPVSFWQEWFGNLA